MMDQNKKHLDPPLIRDLKAMAIDLQNAIKRIADLEYRMNAMTELPGELDIRLQECERLLDNWSEKIVGKKPHKCPVCDGTGNNKGVMKGSPKYNFVMEYASCDACEGQGIVWG